MKTLNEKLAAARENCESLIKCENVVHRNRVYCSPIHANFKVEYHWISYPIGSPKNAVTYVEKDRD